jgi:hypothetical protein
MIILRLLTLKIFDMKSLLFILSFIALSHFNLYSQDIPLPEYYGIYSVVNGKLYEFNKSNAAKISGVGNLVNTTLGIKHIYGPWFNDAGCYFIIYGKPLKLELIELTWKSKVNVQNPMDGSVSSIDANMYVPSRTIALRVAPIKDLQNCYKYVPAEKLTEGYYCLDDGSLSSHNAMEISNEANSNSNVFDFAITYGLRIRGDLNKCDFDKGEYILPKNYGLFFIENKKYVKMPFNRKSKNIIEYGDISTRRKGLLQISEVVFDSAQLERVFVSFSEYNIRGKVRVSLTTANHKDIIPEKMYLSKLKKITVDTRSKHEINKGKPQELKEVWIEDKEIPIIVKTSGFYYPLVALIVISKPLSPGVYAFHNGLLKGLKHSFGVQNIIYSFTVK